MAGAAVRLSAKETGPMPFVVKERIVSCEMILLVYIAIILTINVVMEMLIYVEGINKSRDYISSVNRLCNLIAERLDLVDSKNQERRP